MLEYRCQVYQLPLNGVETAYKTFMLTSHP